MAEYQLPLLQTCLVLFQIIHGVFKLKCPPGHSASISNTSVLEVDLYCNPKGQLSYGGTAPEFTGVTVNGSAMDNFYGCTPGEFILTIYF